MTVVQAPSRFTDVLYLTNQSCMPSDIKHLLKRGKLSFLLLSIDEFSRVHERLDLIGTVIIDGTALDASQQQKLPSIIESLEAKGIGTILLKECSQLPAKRFTLTHKPAGSSSLAGREESVSLDDLWVRISLNLAYSKNESGIIAKPSAMPVENLITGDGDLTEQLCMAETLVDNLAEQLRLAGLVQRDFLPTQLPDCPEVQWSKVFLPAEWVSGDIYDVVRIDENHIGFYIADVVGHGIPAALLTIFLKQSMAMRQTIDSSYHIFSPKEVMTNLNARMTSQKFSGYQFATCCYCLLSTDTLQLTYSRAGHPYPVLLRSDSQPEQLELKGPLLGIFQQAEYAQETVQLQRGDKLLLYSDGAESIIGNFDDQAGFVFNEEFCEIKSLPIIEMVDRLKTLARNRRLDLYELDDVTIVGFELL